MFTPQQIDQISFGKATFGGYNMDDVDSFLEPLCEDYVTLYKENALLKSKMRVLVGKLEEYRKNEAAMKDAVVNAQRTCDKMVREAEAKCAQMLSDANATAQQNVQNTGALVAAEAARVQEARKLASSKIDEIQEQMRSCIQALDRIKMANQPEVAAAPAAPVVEEPVKIDADAVAEEISQNLEALVGTTVDTAPKAEPRHPVNDSTTAKFANLQFGRNYDLGRK
jgi:cell division initiation protein